MHTYTHLLIGGAFAAVLYPKSLPIQAAFIAGSVAPDLVMVPSFILDKIRGRQPLAKQGRTTLFLKELSHSFPISLIFTALFTLFMSANTMFPVLSAFFAAMMAHIMIDAFTHCDPKYRSTDQSCLFPFNARYKLSMLMGTWDYRYDHGVLTPKPAEFTICIVATTIWAIAFTVR